MMFNSHYDPNQPRNAEGEWTDAGTAIRAAASDKKPFVPATTWDEGIKFMRDNSLAYDIDGLSKADVDTLNAVNKVLYESKQDYGIQFDKITFSKTQPKNYWIPAEHKLTLDKDGLVKEARLTINQGHIDWAKRKSGTLENYLAKDNWLVSKNLEGIIHHEYGHLITIGRFSSKQEIVKWQKGLTSQRIEGISGYGKTHGEEALAEIWAKYKMQGKQSLSADHINFFNTHSIKIKI